MNENPRDPDELDPHPWLPDEPSQPITPIVLVRGEGLPPEFRFPPRPYRPRRKLALILFLLTCASTVVAGYFQFRVLSHVEDQRTGKIVKPTDRLSRDSKLVLVFDWRQSLLNGLTYSIAVMTVLGAHEMGHYLQARRYGVPASLPYFIPMPFSPLGTMGAVIVQQAGVADRKALFDIAISGPLAGLAVAIPLNWWGILHTTINKVGPGGGGFTNPPIVEWMIAWLQRPLQPGEDVALTPILHAGWVGILITAINLIPIGQLDGGHLLYCLIGKPAQRVARALYFAAIGVVVYHVVWGSGEYVYLALLLGLIGLMGAAHPPTANDRVPLGWPRIILGWLTLAFIFVGFVPSPMYENKPQPPPAAPRLIAPVAELAADAKLPDEK
ncbi:MAG: site-2 protease family protein [Planctomycetales bacterium]